MLSLPEPWCAGIGPEQEERIKKAVEGTCELCREYTPLSLLFLHGFPIHGRRRRIDDVKERERHILVVCEPCHKLIHAEPVPDRKLHALIAKRPYGVRREILSALGYIPKPFIPPED